MPVRYWVDKYIVTNCDGVYRRCCGLSIRYWCDVNCWIDLESNESKNLSHVKVCHVNTSMCYVNTLDFTHVMIHTKIVKLASLAAPEVVKVKTSVTIRHLCWRMLTMTALYSWTMIFDVDNYIYNIAKHLCTDFVLCRVSSIWNHRHPQISCYTQETVNET